HENRSQLKKEWFGLLEKGYKAGLFDDILKRGERLEFYGAGPGCAHCNRTGYRDRIGIFEMRKPKPQIIEMLTKGSYSEAVAEQHYAEDVKRGDLLGRTMLQDGIIKAARGETSVEEVIIATNIRI